MAIFQPTHIHGLQVPGVHSSWLPLRHFNPLVYTDCKPVRPSMVSPPSTISTHPCTRIASETVRSLSIAGVNFNPLVYTDCKTALLSVPIRASSYFNPLVYTDCKGYGNDIASLGAAFQPTRIHGLQGGVENSSTHLIPVFGFCEPH